MSARFARAGLRATQFSVARPAAVNGMRSYATAQEVRAPVALFGVDGTYATALVCTSIASVLHATLPTTPAIPVHPRPLLERDLPGRSKQSSILKFIIHCPPTETDL